MVDANLDQQMEEVLNVTGDDPLSDAMGDRLVTQQTSMLADVAGKDGMIYEPDQKLDYRDTMGLLFPLTPNDPIFDDIKKMFEEEAYGPAIATSALATLAVIPGFGRLPKSAAKKIARETAESLKKSKTVEPDVAGPTKKASEEVLGKDIIKPQGRGLDKQFADYAKQALEAQGKIELPDGTIISEAPFKYSDDIIKIINTTYNSTTVKGLTSARKAELGRKVPEGKLVAIRPNLNSDINDEAVPIPKIGKPDEPKKQPLLSVQEGGKVKGTVYADQPYVLVNPTKDKGVVSFTVDQNLRAEVAGGANKDRLMAVRGDYTEYDVSKFSINDPNVVEIKFNPALQHLAIRADTNEALVGSKGKVLVIADRIYALKDDLIYARKRDAPKALGGHNTNVVYRLNKGGLLDDQMEELFNVTGDDPLSDAYGDERLISGQVPMERNPDLEDLTTVGKDFYGKSISGTENLTSQMDKIRSEEDYSRLFIYDYGDDRIQKEVIDKLPEDSGLKTYANIVGPQLFQTSMDVLQGTLGIVGSTTDGVEVGLKTIEKNFPEAYKVLSNNKSPSAAAASLSRDIIALLEVSEAAIPPITPAIRGATKAVKSAQSIKPTAESLKKSESKVAPDLDIPPAPPKRNRLTEQNTYDLPIDNSVFNYIDETDNYYSKLFDDILGLESSKLVDKDGNIKVKVFEKWLSENAPAGQAKYTGLQNLIDNAKKEGVEKLSVLDTIATRYDNNRIVLTESVRRFNPNDNSIDRYGRLLDIPHNVSDPRHIYYSDHNNRFFVGGGGSNFTSNNITIDPTINRDYGTGVTRSKKEAFSENILYPNVKPLIDVRNYEEMIVSLPALPKDTKVSVSPLPRTKTSFPQQRYFPSQYKLADPDAIKTFPTRKDYTHSHYPNELTNLFHIRYTKNADIGDGKSDTFIWHEGQSDITQRRQYVEYDEDGNPLKDEYGNIITRPVVTQIDKTNPKTGIARSLETRYREAEVADELLQKRQKAIEGMDKPTVTVRGKEKREPYFPDPDYFEQDSDLRERIKEGLGDVSFSERSVSRVHDNIDSTLAAEKPSSRRIDKAEDNFLDPYGRDINFTYNDPGSTEPKRILPEIPFLKGDEADKSKITNLMFQRALKQAIDSGHDKFAWPTSETIRKFSGGSDAPTGVLKTYDEDFINMAKKIYNSTKKPKDPAFEEWWRMEERVRPISFEGTFKIKDDVSQTDLYQIAENIENGLNTKKQRIHNKMEELKVEQRQNPNDKELKELQEIYENQFKELVVSQQNVLLRIDQFKKNIQSGEARQNLIKEINNIYSKPSGIKLEKQFKPHVIPGSKGKRVDNLMPHIENNPLVGDLVENANIQNYYVMEITPEMKAMFSRGIPFNKGGIVQDKMDNQMKQLFAK
tara:strand:- start:1035 stop:5189 length:4155 start_codon:yes stop_codon:yes gene_type:complete